MIKAVLGLDCTGETYACGLSTEDGAFTSVTGLNPRRALRELPGHIAYLMRNANVTYRDVVGVGVTSGPGSFTGVRLGVTLAKTIAFTCGCEIADFDTLELLARGQFSSFAAGAVGVALDARRGEVYSGIFGLDEECEVLLETGVRRPNVFQRELLHAEDLRVLVGSGFSAYPELVPSEFKGPVQVSRQALTPCMDVLCDLTWKAFRDGGMSHPGQVSPVYHRRADIQVAR